MAIDWSKVGESAVLIVPTAFVSAYVGARIKAYLDRARPVVSVSSCRVASGRDLLGFRVSVPKDLALRLRESPWGPSFTGDVNAARVEAGAKTVRKSIADAREVLAFLDQKLQELPRLEKAPKQAKLTFLDEITRSEVAIVDACMTGSLCRKEISLPLPSDDELAKTERITEYVDSEDEDSPGYLIHLGTKWYGLGHKRKQDKPLLLPLAKAFVHFHLPSLLAMLQHVRNDIVQWAAAGDSIGDDLDKLTRAGRRLIVELSIVNRGRSAALFTQWALLRLFGNDRDQIPEIRLIRTTPLWRPDDPVLAARQEEILREMDESVDQDNRGFAVEGGVPTKLSFQSVEPLSELEKKIPKLDALLSMEVFMCQVAVRRADVLKAKSSWVFSTASRFGRSGERFPDEDVGSLKKKWNSK